MSTDELVVDNFAGGGGASTGIEMAIGRSVDIAINHDPAAIAMHKENHPKSKHYCEDVFDVDPIEACNGKPVALAWFSPDCKHFSRAKGGKPVDKKIRGLAWIVLRWAYLVRPRVLMMENVPEIVTWGPLGEDNKPLKDRLGETFDGFLAALSRIGLPREHPAFKEMCDTLGISPDSDMAKACEEGLGYVIEYREIKSCDLGAPTTRKRFYMIARCDGAQIIWPAPTHGDKHTEEVKCGKLLPYRTAAECIDWSIPAKSIFERKKPLAEKTLRRIAKGIQKFVIDNPNPFIIHYKFENEPESIDKPLSAITAVNGHYVVTPTIMCNNTGNQGASVDSPCPTITTGNRNYVVAPSIVPIGYGERKGQEPRVNDVKNPLGTIVSSGKHYLSMPILTTFNQNSKSQTVERPLDTVMAGATRFGVVAPTIIQYHSEQKDNEVRGQDICKPLDTVDTSNRYALSVANIMKNYGGNYKGAGSSVDAPLDTVTAKDHNSLVTAHILTMRKNMDGQPMDEPLTTIACSGAHHAEVQAFLVKYFSNGQPKPVDEPLDTITTKDRFAVITIHGEEYIIMDIKMRMLQPRELFNAQGFPRDYIIDRAGGKSYPKCEQVKRCGNAVTPDVPKALVQANLPELCRAI